MKKQLLYILFYCLCSPALFAQWTLNTEHSADYECTLGTIEEDVKRGRVHIEYTIRDTLLFDVRRTIKRSGKAWEIGYEILKTYEIGLFRKEQPRYSPKFPVDKNGNLKADYYPKEKLSRVDKRIYDYLKLTLLPFPRAALNYPYTWKANVGGEQLEFSVSDGFREKIGRQCFMVYFESESFRLKGEMFLEKSTGQLVYLEWTKNMSPCPRCYGNKYSIRLSLRDPSGLIESKLKEFAAGESEIARLHQSYNWVVPMEHHRIQSMSYNIDHRGYIVEQNGYFGWLNEHGGTILPPSHDMVEQAAGQLMYRANGGNICLIDSTNRVLMDSLDENLSGWGPQYSVQPVMRKGKWLIINQQGEIENTYLKSSYASLSGPEANGTIKVSSHQGKYGLIRGNRVIIPVEFTYFDLYAGKGLISGYKDSMAYLFDVEGNVQFSRKGGEIGRFVGNYYPISGEGLFNWKTQKFICTGKDFTNLYDLRDKFFILNNTEDFSKLLFDSIGHFIGKFKDIIIADESGVMIASDIQTERFGILDFEGKWLVQPIYKRISELEKEIFLGESQVWNDSRSILGLFRVNGETILPLKFDRIFSLGSGKYYIEYSTQKGIFTLADSSFTALPENLLFLDVKHYDEEIFLVVKKGDKTGLLDINCKEVVPFEFSKIGNITRYGVVVEAHGKVGVIKRS